MLAADAARLVHLLKVGEDNAIDRRLPVDARQPALDPFMPPVRAAEFGGVMRDANDFWPFDLEAPLCQLLPKQSPACSLAIGSRSGASVSPRLLQLPPTCLLASIIGFVIGIALIASDQHKRAA